MLKTNFLTLKPNSTHKA